MSFFSNSQKIKEYIKRIDQLWFKKYENFISKIQDKEGFSELFVSLNPNTCIKTMLLNPKLVGTLELFSSNPNLTFEIVKSIPQVNWNYQMFSPEFLFTKQFLLDNLDKDFDWESISQNKHVSMDDIETYHQIPWNFRGVSANPNLDLYHLEKFYQTGKDLDWFEISKHRNFNMRVITSNKHLPWNSKGMSLNPNINFNMVSINPFTKWDYTLLSSNPNIKIEDIRRTMRLPWSWTNLSTNPNLTIPFIRKFIDKNWNWNILSSNSAFTFSMIRINCDLPWDMKGVSQNPNITFNMVLKNPNLNWDYSNLCSNTFEFERDRFYQTNLRYYFMCSKIQRVWRKQSTNLNCAIGRKISTLRYDSLLKEHEEMYGFDENGGIDMIDNSAYC